MHVQIDGGKARLGNIRYGDAQRRIGHPVFHQDRIHSMRLLLGGQWPCHKSKRGEQEQGTHGFQAIS